MNMKEALLTAMERAIQDTVEKFPDEDEELVRECATKIVQNQYGFLFPRNEITLFDYQKVAHTFPLESTAPIDYLEVSVVTGDELVTVFHTDGTATIFDADVKGERMRDYDDGHYIVAFNEIEEWEKRTGPYEYYGATRWLHHSNY